MKKIRKWSLLMIPTSTVPKVLFFKTTDLYTVYLFSEYAMLLDLYVLLSLQEEEVLSSSYGNRCTHLAAHSSKRLNLLSVIILVCLGNT